MCGRDEGSGCAGACAEITDGQVEISGIAEPFCYANEAMGEEWYIKTQMRGAGIKQFFLFGEEIKEESGDIVFLKN